MAFSARARGVATQLVKALRGGSCTSSAPVACAGGLPPARPSPQLPQLGPRPASCPGPQLPAVPRLSLQGAGEASVATSSCSGLDVLRRSVQHQLPALPARQTLGGALSRGRWPLGEEGVCCARYGDSAAQSAVVAVQTSQEFQSLLTSAPDSQLVVVDFTAGWCRPCQMIAPLLDELSLKHKDITVLKVDIDKPELQETVESARVDAVPTFHFYKAGEMKASFSGADRNKLEDMITVLQKT